MIIICPHCKKKKDVPAGYVNRAKKLGVPRYCTKKCSGLARRINRSETEKKAIKSAYDKKYREKNYDWKQFSGALCFGFDYLNNPEKYRLKRKAKQSSHNEYCRQPKYKKYKKEYDLVYTSKKKYGEFWEAGKILRELNVLLPSKQIKYNQGLINKTQKRKRKWQTKNKRSMLRA